MTNTWWTKQELEELAGRMARGEKAMLISEQMHKPHVAVRHQMRWVKLTTQQKKERAKVARAKRLVRDAEKSALDYRAYSRRRPTAGMIAERDYIYYEAPRTITAIMFGDPPAGRSALDKRVSA